jgi:uncharacterized protein
MKYILTLLLLATATITFAQSGANPNYDQVLAEQLGADELGMKSYYFVILKTGSNTTADSELVRASFRGHLDNINRLAQEEKLVVAGPLGENTETFRGIFILQNIGSIEEAKELLLTDPAIEIGLLDFDIFSWYGSAALPMYLPYSDKIWVSRP